MARYTGSRTAWAVALGGGFAYLAEGTAGLSVLDISDPTNPRRVGGIDIGGVANGVVVAGQLAYVSSSTTGIHVIDVSNSGNPRPIGAYSSADGFSNIALAGNLVCLTDSDGAFHVIDVSTPASPRRVGGDTARDVYFTALAVSDRYAYVANAEGALQVIDLGNPAAPRRVGGSSAFNPSDVFADHAHVYVAGSDGLIILNKYTELRIGPAIVLSDGRLQLQLTGASGQGVRVQRSADLVDWEDWRTVTLDGTGCELIDETTGASQRFYRAVEDNSVATK